MSGRLVSAVFDSTLPAWLKRYAAAYASFAAPDGSRVYPSRKRVARLVGRSERSTQRAIQELRRRGVLALEAAPVRQQTPRYQFRAIALPQIGDENQLALFPQAGVQKPGVKQTDPDVFHSHAQGLTGHGCLPWGDMGVSRSVSDPSVRTSTKGATKKTGTEGR
jgi:hypothetical protein